MIALDAALLIALLNPVDAHHARAEAFFAENLDETLYLSHLNYAEILVHPARQGVEDRVSAEIAELGVIVLPPPPESGVKLAQLRAQTSLKLPDCCVILAAQQSDARIATFDVRLAREAERLGFDVVGGGTATPEDLAGAAARAAAAPRGERM